MIFLNGSGYADPYLLLMEPVPAPAIFVSDLQEVNNKKVFLLSFLLITFLRYIYITFPR
jgi:hypothetical protein